jgi:glucose-1-phosphate thymidylyltransferase
LIALYIKIKTKFYYQIQDKPAGIVDGIIKSKQFIKNSDFMLILGDNFFYGQSLSEQIRNLNSKKNCIVSVKNKNPKEFGVIQYKNKNIYRIIEKPKEYISNNIVTGLYVYENNVIKICEGLKPSARNELEITDVLKFYQKNNNLKYEEIGRGAIWSDAGKIEDLTNLSNFVHSVEKVQNIKIACIDEISFNQKWINKAHLRNNIKYYGNCDYSNYLKKL